MKKKILLAALLVLGIPKLTHAAIFDAADIVKPQKHSIGALTEAVLSNPSSTGVELRLKRGINDGLNVQAILGTGTENRKTRFGLLSTINFFPDADGQPGISLLTSGLYLKRESYSALQLMVGPMVHKSINGFQGYPLNLYAALPWALELHSGNYNTSMQLVLGGNFDINSNRNWNLNTEVGFSLSRAETYIALGIAYRFGTFDSLVSKSFSSSKSSKENNEEEGEELRSEDFNKPIR